MFNPFKKKEAPKQEVVVEPPKPVGLSDSDKIRILEQMVIEQRLMTRQLLKITTMLAEHKRFELIQLELHKLSNTLDKIK